MNGSRLLIIVAGLAGASAVLLAAASAHSEWQLSAEAQGWIGKGIRYQVWHALALLAVAALHRSGDSKQLTMAGVAFAIGIPLFSGGLYLAAFSGLRLFAWLTPLGGIAFVAGWLLLAWHGLRGRSTGTG
jgi:uncharacterized membrane protein YgdD (TMEM256/DUF423 family)